MTETRPTDRTLPDETQAMTGAESVLADRPGHALAAAYDETRVAIELNGGETLSCHVDHVIGSSGKPMTDQDIEQKFRGLTESLLPKPRVDQLIDTCANIMKIDDAAVLARLAALE